MVRALILALALVCAGPLKAQEAPPLPDQRETARLVWSTLIAVDQANQTGNYTVLRDLGAPGFAAANDAGQLAQIFAASREARLPLGLVVLENPVFAEPPRLLEDGRLYLKGSFPGRPSGVAFELLFEWVNGEWRLYGISVGPEAAAPVAAEPAASGN